MRSTRIFCEAPLASGIELSLPPTGAYHVARVLRMRAGALLSVFDGTGQEHRAEITRIAADRVTVKLGEHIASTTESPLKITLLQGVSRAERMDWTLQKATELGVAAITPVLTARSVVRLDEKQAQKKHAHWRGIVIAACEQCGRSKIPLLGPLAALRDHLALTRAASLRLVLSPAAPGSLAELARAPDDVELLIGPEGGLEEHELMLAQRAGFMPVRLGPRVLRTETAAVVALAVLQALWGDLR